MLREKLFTLWGDLEEEKLKLMALGGTGGPVTQHAGEEDLASRRPGRERQSKPGDMPKLDSSPEPPEQPTLGPLASERPQSSMLNSMAGLPQGPGERGLSNVRNKGFSCCIQEYGVKTATNDAGQETAGPGMRWQRQFGLFGTAIK